MKNHVINQMIDYPLTYTHLINKRFSEWKSEKKNAYGLKNNFSNPFGQKRLGAAFFVNKLARLRYGIKTTKFVRKLSRIGFLKASSDRSVNVFSLFDRKLDYFVFSSGYSTTLGESKQAILHDGFNIIKPLVKKENKSNVSSSILKESDMIIVSNDNIKKSITNFTKNLSMFTQWNICNFLHTEWMIYTKLCLTPFCVSLTNINKTTLSDFVRNSENFFTSSSVFQKATFLSRNSKLKKKYLSCTNEFTSSMLVQKFFYSYMKHCAKYSKTNSAIVYNYDTVISTESVDYEDWNWYIGNVEEDKKFEQGSQKIFLSSAQKKTLDVASEEDPDYEAETSLLLIKEWEKLGFNYAMWVKNENFSQKSIDFLVKELEGFQSYYNEISLYLSSLCFFKQCHNEGGILELVKSISSFSSYTNVWVNKISMRPLTLHDDSAKLSRYKSGQLVPYLLGAVPSRPEVLSLGERSFANHLVRNLKMSRY